MDLNPFNTSKFGWIDSNLKPNCAKICENYEKNMLLKILSNSRSDKFHLQILNVCDKKYKEKGHKKEMYQQYRWIVCGCLFVTGIEVGKKIPRPDDDDMSEIMTTSPKANFHSPPPLPLL